ncbi:hypothetical protein BGI33_07055 [Snodgrassella alvi]|nr:hypothetical protein BGI33_07055 [Snodgrassella alvi]PIT17493.1 hypothetical protein BGI34_07115 [Snodgrassella alvi]
MDTDGNQEQHIRYFHTDLNGCPEELTDANGKILWECSFQLWGKRIHEIEHEPIEQNLRYQGQYLDRETGLHYNTFRYYDPDIGRFTQPDPIGLLGGLNLYQYAPNGLTWVDPWGCAKKDLSGVDASGRPLSSSGYSVWYQTEIPENIQTSTRAQHFKNANEQLYNVLKNNPDFAKMLPPEVVAHVQPGPRGGFKGTSPPEHSWHHNAHDPTKIELIPRSQHKAPGPVQGNLHPNQKGGFKKLGGKC